ncbi:iron complex transport system substrate-binding protein [Aureibacillus halotolerans]|uniref:Iron complex transport system substrate-binding protein n=2 Tax=Aureibacillus halotolerans TaxID=1508390 RepID=A0A4R6TTW1_9BACI|nr:iron complex transport system substrate-binding protein [Aureibacillus halotolerans]
MVNVKLKMSVFFIVFMLILAGCGGGAATSGESEDQGEATTTEETASGDEAEASADATDAAATGPITIEHNKGETTLDKPAERVVVLEWSFTENLLALGVQPVGNADSEAFPLWVATEEPLGEDVTDVGTRAEPNLETIASLQPDLIISLDSSHDAVYDQLNAIAPTLQFKATGSDLNAYDYSIEVFNKIAKAVGKTEAAETYLAELQQTYDDAKATLEEAGKAGLPYVITQAFTSQNSASLRLFNQDAHIVQTLENIGLENEWVTDEYIDWGFTTSTVEALPAIQDTNLIYIVQDDDNVFETTLKGNSIWEGLNFVKEGRTYQIDGSTWTFGGPTSSKFLVERVVEALTQ